MNNVANLDATTLSHNASLSSLHTFKMLKNKEEEQKIPRTKNFTDIIKEKLALSTSSEEKENIILREQEYLAKLQDDVYSAGDALADTVSPENILAYKKSIKAFVEYILNSAYEVENIVTGSLNPARKKAWTIVKVINEKLDKLISELMYSQLKKIEVLRRIDEIKGLIVDLKG